MFLDDVSPVQNKELIERLIELNKIVLQAHLEIKELSIETLKNAMLV